MGIAAFGPGIAIVTRTDVTPSTPVNVGFAQSLSLSLKGSTKDLYGQNQFPLVSARSTIKATGKIVSAVDSGLAFNNMFVGQSFQSGGITWNINEPHSVPASSAYTVTTTNSATFDADLGVVYASTGLPLTNVGSGSLTAAGQYKYAAGIYTFYLADASAAILITYSSTVTGGQSLTVANKLIGVTPTFQLDYYTTLNQPSAKSLIFRVFACISDSADFSFKLEDFMMPSFDFSVFANAAGNIFEKVYSEVS